VIQKACPLFVPLVEEGRDERNPVVRLTVAEYLEPVRRLHPAVVVLGCTHYPMLRGVIADFLGDGVALIDTSEATAGAVAELLRGADSLSGKPGRGRLFCYVSDNPQRFQSLSTRFLGHTLTDVVRISPEEFAVLHQADAPPAKLRVSI
jgi:glutamate racemase